MTLNFSPSFLGLQVLGPQRCGQRWQSWGSDLGLLARKVNAKPTAPSLFFFRMGVGGLGDTREHNNETFVKPK